MFTCFAGGRPPHSHTLVHEARLCAGLIQPPARPVRTEPPVTQRQLDYIRDLGGDLTKAAAMSKVEASAYIDLLKKKGPEVTTSAPMPAPVKSDAQKRLEMIAYLMESIPSGYYATQADEYAKVNYLRVSRPTRQRYSGSIKIQTQHGPRLEVAAAFWKSGKVSVYDSRVVEMLMLLVPDFKGCAMRYAKLMERCCRCNAELTDARSQHYGIGPECEKIFPWVIEEIDEQHNGKSFEQLPHNAR